MQFHHLIELNDPLLALPTPISRVQLWYGLVLRAESPQLFLPHLDQCILGRREEFSVQRELRFGDLTVFDTVHFSPLTSVVYLVPSQGEIPSSRLTMTIEEPVAEQLFIRFDYDDGKSAEQDEADAFYDEFRRSAYLAADLDTVRLIREFAADGRFDRPLS